MQMRRVRCEVAPLSSPLLLSCLTLLQSLFSATLDCFLHACFAVTFLCHSSCASSSTLQCRCFVLGLSSFASAPHITTSFPNPPQVPLEYQVLGYEPEPFPGLTPYAPPLLEQPLMAGAAEEEPDSAPSSVIQPLDKLPTLPDSVHQMPYVILEIGNRWVLDCGAECAS